MTVILNSSDVQQNFGAALDHALRGDDVIVARYGAPRVALIEYERYQKLMAAAQALSAGSEADSEAATLSQREQLKEAAASYLLKRDRTAEKSSVQGQPHASLPSTGVPYVTSAPDVCGGRPTIQGTRIPVKTIVGYHKLGLPVDEILDGLPALTAAQVYAALSYYYDHQEEIEREIQESQQAQLIARYGLEVAADGRITLAR